MTPSMRLVTLMFCFSCHSTQAERPQQKEKPIDTVPGQPALHGTMDLNGMHGVDSGIAKFPDYNLDLALDNKQNLAKEGGSLEKLPEMFEKLAKLYDNTAKTVWEGGDVTGKNIIQAAGNKWVDSSRNFDKDAGEMKEVARKAYERMVEVHNAVGKDAMDTFYQEIIKLKNTMNAHEHIAVDANALQAKGKEQLIKMASEGGGAHAGLEFPSGTWTGLAPGTVEHTGAN